jgi:large subunit ribosomal protein L24
MHFNAPLHKRRKMLSSHLAENLLLKYDRRNTSVVKGDTVKVMRGSFKGHEDKVVSVDLKKQIVEVEGITTVKSDGTKVPKPVHASNLLITKLNLTDKWRRNKLEKGLSETTKKEIEKEAENQIKEKEKIEAEEEKARAKAEEEIESEEKVESDEKEPESVDKQPTKKIDSKPKTEDKEKKDEVKTEKPKIPKEPKTTKAKTPPKKSVKKPAKKNTTKKEAKK